MKKVLSLFLAFLFVIGGISMAYAENSSAKLYGTYGDNMLFQQNKDAVFAGTAAAGAQISAELYNAAGELVASGNSTALADGVSLSALNVSPLTQIISPMWGLDPCFSSPTRQGLVQSY